MFKYLIAISLIIIMISCTEKPQSIEKETAESYIPEAWVDARVAEATSKLTSTEAGKIVWQAMEAHGGLEKWLSNGPISFQFDYKPRGKGARRNTSQVVDTWNNLTVHKDVADETASFGWNGEKAWVTMKDTANFDYNLRFWSLTPIFFLAQPFNFDGAGVVLEKLEDKSLDSILYDAIKISFEAGTGDAPDDYYINYFDKNTHQLKVIRYIVSYPKYFKGGGHSPEKMMTLDNFKTVDGITLPTEYKTYMTTENESKGEYVTDIEVSNIKFMPSLEKSYFEMPKGAEVLDEL